MRCGRIRCGVGVALGGLLGACGVGRPPNRRPDRTPTRCATTFEGQTVPLGRRAIPAPPVTDPRPPPRPATPLTPLRRQRPSSNRYSPMLSSHWKPCSDPTRRAVIARQRRRRIRKWVSVTSTVAQPPRYDSGPYCSTSLRYRSWSRRYRSSQCRNSWPSSRNLSCSQCGRRPVQALVRNSTNPYGRTVSSSPYTHTGHSALDSPSTRHRK